MGGVVQWQAPPTGHKTAKHAAQFSRSYGMRFVTMSRLTEMKAFATVVKEGGFADAARRMGISKPAVSKHISSLETRLGARLLSRTTRRVSPTEIGLAYYDRAGRILNDAGEADALVTALHATPAGALQVGAPYDFGSHQISPLLADFLVEFPDVNVNLEPSHQKLDLISSGFGLAVRVGAQKTAACASASCVKPVPDWRPSPGTCRNTASPARSAICRAIGCYTAQTAPGRTSGS
ncbi:MAG: DNA-binding transcriptional LysR family regulator [Paracoccaceae bacterium]|jgi:DNA-binding transcriptional LysR family regulator